MNNIHGGSLIYGVREQSISQGYQECKNTQQGNVYMNKRHRNAETDRNKKQDLY